MLLAQAGLRDVLERGRDGPTSPLVSVGTLGPAATNRRIGLLGDRRTRPSSDASVPSATCSAPSSTPQGRPVDHPLNAARSACPWPT